MLKHPDTKVEFRGYTTAHGELMLDVYFDSNHHYKLGPFENKQQREVLVDGLRSTLGIRVGRWT